MLSAWESGAEASPEAAEDRESIVDATGNEVPVARYGRIASASSIADQVLLRILEPERIVAVTAHSTLAGPEPWRFEGFTKIESLERIETVVTLQPDLVLVSNVMDDRRIARLRDAELVVFDIGPMRGMETFLPALETIGALTGERERAERIAARFGAGLVISEMVASGEPLLPTSNGFIAITRRPASSRIGMKSERIRRSPETSAPREPRPSSSTGAF